MRVVARLEEEVPKGPHAREGLQDRVRKVGAPSQAVEADEAEAEPARPADDHQRNGWQSRNLGSTHKRRRQHDHGV